MECSISLHYSGARLHASYQLHQDHTIKALSLKAQEVFEFLFDLFI